LVSTYGSGGHSASLISDMIQDNLTDYICSTFYTNETEADQSQPHPAACQVKSLVRKLITDEINVKSMAGAAKRG